MGKSYMIQGLIVVLIAISYWFSARTARASAMVKTPVYFLSHGGPTFMYRKSGFGGDVGAFDATAKVGKYIRDVVKPKFVVVVSAHWQSDSNKTIGVGIPSDLPENELIYDFYGFPNNMYYEKFRSRNDLSMAGQIVKDLNAFFSQCGSVRASLVQRGIDHGVWVPLKVVFPTNLSQPWDLNCSLIQVSLTADETDFDTHYKLGQALSQYRSQGGLILVSGMSVHNLSDMMKTTSFLPYVAQFNELVRSILTQKSSGADKLEEFKKLLNDPAKRKLLNAAHPTLEHLVPLIVGLGAGAGSNNDGCVEVEELYNKNDVSMGWGIYKFSNPRD